MSNKHIVSQLSKILIKKDAKKLDKDLTKTKLNIDDVTDFIKNNIKTYLKPINIIFRNSLEHVNLKYFNQITDSFSDNLDYTTISDLDISDDTLYLYSKKDVIDNYEGANLDTILEKYFQGSDIGIQKKTICDNIDKNEVKLSKIYEEDKQLEKKFSDQYGQKLEDMMNNRMSSISLLINNFFYQDCDIQRLFNLIELDENIVFSKFSVKRKRQFYKIYKPSFFGKTAKISKNDFSSA